MTAGRIIVLNGTSSSGKSSVAKALQEVLAEPYLHLGIDTFIAMLPARWFGESPPADEGFLLVKGEAGTAIETGPVGQRLVKGMADACGALAAAGNNLIVDHVLLERKALLDLVDALAPFSVLFVGIHCPLAVAIQREQGRSDRTAGMAQAQHHLVHAHAVYDLEIDTSTCSAREAALRIKRRLEEGLEFTAIRQLRNKGAVGAEVANRPTGPPSEG
jgi:chloramphenicol 3-O phosphotransferase